MAGFYEFFENRPFSLWPLSNSTYKIEKEAWVTGYNGSSLPTVFLLASIFPALVLFNSVLLSFLIVTFPNAYFIQLLTTKIKKKSFSFIPRLIFEFFTIVLPSLFAMNTSIDALWSVGLPMEVLIVGVSFVLHYLSKHFNNVSLLAISTPPNLKGLFIRQPTFISQYRSYMMLSTIIAILAVDFSIFPREHAKSETYGISLMDMGVGAVIFASALVSRQTRLSVESKSMTQEEFTKARFRHLLSALSSVAPLIFLGSIRIIAHTLIGYQLHESEYGLHWNFFFTVAAVTLLASLLLYGYRRDGVETKMYYLPPILGRNYLLFIFIILNFFPLPLLFRSFFLPFFVNLKGSSAVIPISSHQGFGPDKYCKTLSSIKTFSEYILCASRSNFVSNNSSSRSLLVSLGRRLVTIVLQNREGVFGLQGFFSIYLIGLYVGTWIFEFISEGSGLTVYNYLSTRSDASLWGVSILAFLSWFWLSFNPHPQIKETRGWFGYLPAPSRRLVDLQYCCSVIAFNLFILALLFNVNIRTLRPVPQQAKGGGGVEEEGRNDDGERGGGKWFITQQQNFISSVSTTAVRRRGASTAKRKGGGRSASPWRSPSPVMMRQRKSSVTALAGKSATAINTAQASSAFPFSNDILFGGSILLECFNTNFLFLFFFANLLTGIANITLYTVYSSTLVSYSVLTIYLITICTIAVTATVFNVNVKVW